MGEHKRKGDVRAWIEYRDEKSETMDRRQLRRRDFRAGYLAACSGLPSRDEVARALWNLPDNSPDITDLDRLNELADEGGWDYEEARDFLYRQADAVLALIRERIEGAA